jgi:hypothetical protein
LHSRDADLEHVLAIDREIVLDRHARARIERQVVAKPLVADTLEGVARGIVNLFKGLNREIPDGQPADPARSPM